MLGTRCLLLAGLVLAFAYGQTAQAQPAERQDVKYWIFLKDKLDGAGKTTPVEAGYLTARTLERRARRGTTPSSTLDAPLSLRYLDELRRLGITPLVQSRWLNAVSARLDERQFDATRKLPFVLELRPVAQVVPESLHEEEAEPAPLLPLAPPLTRLDYGPSRTQLEVVNAIPPLEREPPINGAGVRLGILDTEFGEFQHPAFAPLVNDGRLLADSNFVGVSQSSRHARSVASIAVGFDEGQLIGPAYGVELIGATTEFAPSETNQEEDNLVAALEWMESQMGVDVVNISLGYADFFDPGQNNYTTADIDGDTGITTRAADMAAALGVIVVSSAGNEGDDSWRFVTMPADGDSVIAVAAVTAGGVRSGFSSIGPTADGRIKPDIAAMGSSVRRANSSTGYGSGNGTSFSSPMVAGVACQMLQVNPELTPIEVRDILRATASQAATPDNLLGWGIIDADAAITEAERCADPAVACLKPISTATEDEVPIPDAFEVRAPYPNPFSDETVLEVRAPVGAGFARMSVYNLLGQRVDVPFEGTLNPGVNRIVLRAATLPVGLYLYTLEGDQISHSGKMMVVR